MLQRIAGFLLSGVVSDDSGASNGRSRNAKAAHVGRLNTVNLYFLFQQYGNLLLLASVIVVVPIIRGLRRWWWRGGAVYNVLIELQNSAMLLQFKCVESSGDRGLGNGLHIDLLVCLRGQK